MKLANRVAMAPMTRARAGVERIPNEMMVVYYVQRSGAGLIIAEAATVSPQANGWNETPGIYTDAMVEGWKRVTEAIHKAGSKVFLQLWHCGRASHPSFHGGKKHVAPSAVKINAEYIHTPNGKQPHETPRALETSEMPAVVEEYRLAAQRAKDAGFDGVEIHGASGYLLDTFLQSKTNLRTDEYGGSIENRYRLLGEVVSAVKSVWDSHRVGVRVSPNASYNDMGSPDYREQFTYAAARLDQQDLAYLHVVDGETFGLHEFGKPMTLSEFRSVFTGPIIGNGGYDKASAEAAIDDGRADMIAFGRPYISNPDLVERYRNNWPLALKAEVSDWYTPAGSKGYTSFPAYSENP